MMSRIDYPNEGRYRRNDFEFRCKALGRNGTISAIGLEITSDDEVVTLTPVTTRGEPGRCGIEVPADKKTLTALARRLLAIAAATPDKA